MEECGVGPILVFVLKDIAAPVLQGARSRYLLLVRIPSILLFILLRVWLIARFLY